MRMAGVELVGLLESFLGGVGGFTGGAGVMHYLPFQTSPALQVMQVTPLKYEEGGQVATQLPL